ncbi:hypothetical protein PVAP13_3KG246927 [Panicum virgatum]|uniref:Uncharacterized protein n=1 Tax=Panicum virgatum TaxID=38727 RepID=A0A8T0V2H1_PANVG|nr:hypothetical protein PVAP13_3KG246927 [Panicum virgatum]
MIPIVASEKEAQIQMTYEISVIEACLLELEMHRYLIPNLSFKIKALQQNRLDIVSLYESLAQKNLYDMDMFDKTLTEKSLQGILCQALEKLGYHWYEGGTPCTREGMYQTSIEVRSTPSPTAEQMFTVYGKTLSRRCEAKERYKIGIGNDNYVQYLLLTNNIR